MVQITVAALLLIAAIAPVIATPIEVREPRNSKYPSRIGAKAKGAGMSVLSTYISRCITYADIVSSNGVVATNTRPQERELEEVDAREPKFNIGGLLKGAARVAGNFIREENEELMVREPRGGFRGGPRSGRRHGGAGASAPEARELKVEEVDAREPRGARRASGRHAVAAPTAEARELEVEEVDAREPKVLLRKADCSLKVRELEIEEVDAREPKKLYRKVSGPGLCS